MKDHVRFEIIGTGKRSDILYAPLLNTLKEAVEDEMIAIADCLMSFVNAIREDKLPEYGPLQARLDQEVTLAMYQSAEDSRKSVRLSLQSESSRKNKH